MPVRSDVVYSYDGTWPGLLCCVFESYARRELPQDICPEDSDLPLLFPVLRVETDLERAGRVARSGPAKMGAEAWDLVQRGFLTCAPDKEMLLLRFARMGFSLGPRVMNHLADDTVSALTKAVLHLNHEAHLFTGFVRFSDYNGLLAAVIEPKNQVLPVFLEHFCSRFSGETFLIYDKTHKMALTHQNGRADIVPLESWTPPPPGAEEREYRAMWRRFYNVIGIEGRYNPKCRMTLMPKRYWGHMTEFERDPTAAPSLEPGRRQLTGIEDGGKNPELDDGGSDAG